MGRHLSYRGSSKGTEPVPSPSPQTLRTDREAWAAGSQSITPPQLLNGGGRLDAMVSEMKEGTGGNGCGQTEMVKGKKKKKEQVLSLWMTRESIPFHPGAEHASSPQEANCAVTLSLSVQGVRPCQPREEASPARGNPHSALPGSPPSPPGEPGQARRVGRARWRDATCSFSCHLRRDKHTLHLHRCGQPKP